jgi:hypothetical protein
MTDQGKRAFLVNEKNKQSRNFCDKIDDFSELMSLFGFVAVYTFAWVKAVPSLVLLSQICFLGPRKP